MPSVNASQARAEAEANLREALVLFIESCVQRGTLEQVRRAGGMRP